MNVCAASNKNDGDDEEDSDVVIHTQKLTQCCAACDEIKNIPKRQNW
jgi:hypothetical protein